ncbi:MAG: acyl-CoA synthetase [Hyphomicrobiales bacterium]|nr:acyl-CoA synthetase [Hyphomicrobiales bacterium]
MLPKATSYAELYADFRWHIPDRFNIGIDVCDRWVKIEPDRVAIIDRDADGAARRWTFGELKTASDRLAAGLRSRGIGVGDRIALLLPQTPETAIAHIAAYKLGAIAVPMALLFGPEALAFRLRDSGARVLITTAGGLAKIAAIDDRPDTLELVLSIDGADGGAEDFHRLIADAASEFAPVDTAANDPALMIYTSGTTGAPKGALHAHRVLLGHLPGVQVSHDFLPQPRDLLWTPADWAWIGGLLDVLMPGLHFGVPVLATRMTKFDPEEAAAVMAEFGVRNVFLPPTALKIMRTLSDPRGRFGLDLRTVGSGGEPLGEAAYDWGREALGVKINEFYGQTECNYVLSSSASIGVSRPGAIGRPVPGHRVGIIDEAGNPVPAGTLGEIAVKRPDPVMFLRYWNNAPATEAKFVGEWLKTGDMGVADDDGYIRFVGRNDDVITSAGYRIGPGEVEDCLIGHPAVALAAVIGKPDPVRTEIVKAFIVLRPEVAVTERLADEIRHHVRERLSAHEYPREIEFVDALPMTTTGKIIRRELRERG